MKKSYLVGYEDEPFVVVETKADAEEMVLSIVQEEVYEADCYYSLPTSWSYGKCLINYGKGHWIQEVKVYGTMD